MIIKISNLGDGVHQLRFDNLASSIGLSSPFTGMYHLNLSLNKTHNQIVLDADLILNAEFECDRCSRSYVSELKTGYRMVYLMGRGESESNDLNVTYLPVDADKINIAKDLTDYAVLSIPMKKLCKEDCKGLCPQCGTDLNFGKCDCGKNIVDDRWFPLMDLKKKLNNN